jgi:hypothetical protein
MWRLTRQLTVGVAMLACLATGACSDDDDNPNSPTGNEVRLIAGLSPFNEVPAVSTADNAGSGLVTITLNLTRNAAGTITAATADFNVSLTGFPSGSVLNAAHIHPGVAGVNGPPAVDTGITAGTISLTSGAASFTRTGIVVAPATAQAIINNPAAFYFNVHTALTPAGAARGQLQFQ